MIHKRLQNGLIAGMLALGLAGSAAALVDPEGHGSNNCSTAVQISVRGCSTFGYYGDGNYNRLVRSFGFGTLEMCRDECTECCDTLDQYGDATRFLTLTAEFCGCAEDIGNPAALRNCARDTLIDNPDLLRFWFSVGAIRGNIFSPPEDRPNTKDLNSSTFFDFGFFDKLKEIAENVCNDVTEWNIQQLELTCRRSCKARFPRSTEVSVPNLPGGNGQGGGGGNNGGGGGGGGGGGFPNPECRDGDPCTDRQGNSGTMTADCLCAVGISGCRDGDPCRTIDGGNGVLNEFCDCTNSYIEEGPSCWMCGNDQDPPRYCEDPSHPCFYNHY